VSVVLVTGGTRGIGRAIADAFAAHGHTVAVCARREPDDCPHPFFAADLRDADACAALVAAVNEQLGGVDVLINNAGGSPWADAATASPRFLTKIVSLNLLSPFFMAQAVYPHMSDHGGVIVNVSSVSGLRASPGTAAYGAAKAGLLNLTKTLAVEWAPSIRVCAVSPGLVATADAMAHYPDPDAIAATVPLNRFATPEDVAEACLYLASDKASYASGTNIVLDGGGDWPAFLRPQGQS